MQAAPPQIASMHCRAAAAFCAFTGESAPAPAEMKLLEVRVHVLFIDINIFAAIVFGAILLRTQHLIRLPQSKRSHGTAAQPQPQEAGRTHAPSAQSQPLCWCRR